MTETFANILKSPFRAFQHTNSKIQHYLQNESQKYDEGQHYTNENWNWLIVLYFIDELQVK